MKIAFRLDANREIGMFHAMRCGALAGTLTALGYKCTFLCREGREIREYALGCGFEFTAVPKMSLQDEIVWMQNKLVEYEAVVIDSYSVSDEYINALNRPGFTVACCDDEALYEYSCDAVINSNIYAPELDFRFGQKRPKLLLGGQYALINREFISIDPIEIKNTASRIFVYFGDRDSRNYTPAAVSVLGSILDVEVVAVLGAMTECDDAVFEAARSNTRIIKNPTSMAKVMRECDMAVIAGDNTVYELAALGIPALIIVQSKKQMLTAQYLDRNGLMKCIGNWQMADFGILRHETNLLLGSHARRLCESGDLVRIVARNGAENSAKSLIKIMNTKKDGG